MRNFTAPGTCLDVFIGILGNPESCFGLTPQLKISSAHVKWTERGAYPKWEKKFQRTRNG